MIPCLAVRIDYTQELLLKLKEAQETLTLMSLQIGSNSDTPESPAQDTNLIKMIEKRDQFKAQIDAVNVLHGQMTDAVGHWLSFIHAPESRMQLLFPLRLLLLQRKTRAILQQCRSDISSIGISCRLMQDEITRLAYKIRADAIRSIQSGDDYTKYQAALDEKAEIVKRLQYLLPTLPGMEQTVLNANDITDVLETLQSIPV